MVTASPAELLGKDHWIKVNMGPLPVYGHIKLFFDDLERSYHNAQLLQLS